MVRTVSGQPGRIPGPQDPASPAGPAGRRSPDPRNVPGARRRTGAFIRRHRLTPYALLLPSAVAIGLLLLWPTVQIAEFSFQNYGLPQVTGAAPTQWVGVANFSAKLSDPEFWLSLNRLGPKMAAFVSSAAMLAWATPAVSASVIFIWLTDPDGGVVDWALARMPSWLGGGAHWAGFSWTNAALPAYTLLTVLVVWQGFPFVAVTVLAGLKTIPAELHESARVDGGGPWRIFWRVTYPLLKPIFLVLLLLSIIWDFGVFTQVYIVIGELGNR